MIAAIGSEWIAAQREIRAAGQSGLPPAAVEQFLASGIRMRANIRRGLVGGGFVLGAWVAGLLLLFAGGKALSALTLKAINVADPNGAATPAELTLRRWYRALIHVAALYYYVSLPIVLVLVLGGLQRWSTASSWSGTFL